MAPARPALRVRDDPDGARWVHVVDPDGGDAGGVLEVRTTAAAAGARRADVGARHVRPGTGACMLALHLAAGDNQLPPAPGVVEVTTSPTASRWRSRPAPMHPEQRHAPQPSATTARCSTTAPAAAPPWSRCGTEAGTGLDVEVTVDPAGASVQAARAGCAGSAGTARAGAGDWWPGVTSVRMSHSRAGPRRARTKRDRPPSPAPAR